MKVITTEQMRTLDRTTIDERGVPGETLMERAGAGITRVAETILESAVGSDPAILLIAGRGNNGGDVFVVARLLVDHGYLNVHVWTTCALSDIKGDALFHLRLLQDTCDVSIREIPEEDQWKHVDLPAGTVLVVDGVLGTGIKGAARGAAAGAIRFMNSMLDRCRVLAVDIPSGLDSDTGECAGDAVFADVTVTMAQPKTGLVQPRAVDHVGRLEVVDIGIPPDLLAPIESDLELVGKPDVECLLKRRNRNDHKGNHGHVLVVAGSRGFAGAAGMCVKSALRSGAGLVTACVPESVAPIIAGWSMEAMVRPCPETASGTLAGDFLRSLVNELDRFDALLAGPGIGRDPETATALAGLVVSAAIPVMLDADGINAFEHRCSDLAGHAADSLVVTPHPGELARLMGQIVPDIQPNRFKTAREAACAVAGTVVLKGAGTIVSTPERRLWINMTGNPGMASGGMGDVLAGLTAGFLAQGLNGHDSACAAVYLHGRAADIAAADTGEMSLLAGDVIEALPFAFREIMPR